MKKLLLPDSKITILVTNLDITTSYKYFLINQ